MRIKLILLLALIPTTLMACIEMRTRTPDLAIRHRLHRIHAAVMGTAEETGQPAGDGSGDESPRTDAPAPAPAEDQGPGEQDDTEPPPPSPRKANTDQPRSKSVKPSRTTSSL